MPRAAVDRVTGVTVQQERFAFEFAMTGRPAVAYRRAYKTNAKQGICATEAGRLLANPHIALRVEHYRKVGERKMEASVERIALELARIAFFDIGKLVDEDGNPIPLHELDEDTRRALNGLDIEEIRAGKGEDAVVIGHVKKYKHVQKTEALRVLAQWRAMLIERKETGKPGEFDHLSDAEVEQQAKEVVAAAVKQGFLKLVPKAAAKKAS